MKIENYTSETQNLIQSAQKRIASERQQVLHPAHLLLELLKKPNRTLEFILTQEEINRKGLIEQTERLIHSYPKTDHQQRYLASSTSQLFERSEALSQSLGAAQTGIEHIFVGLLTLDDQASQLLTKSGLTAEKVKKTIQALQTAQTGGSEGADMNESNKEALERYTVNLNSLAKAGKIDPVIGREEEIRQVTEILLRRTKNNPVLIGEPGVGKTAIAEGLAQHIIDKHVPDTMLDKVILRLDLTQLIAGTKYQGEFEERLKTIVKAVAASHGQIILFIDEIHTLIGAGRNTGAMDAANILKPALARGELRTIGATTLSEYQQHIEKDRAFERRLQPVMVEEPTASATLAILRGLKPRYETHHGVRIKDAALVKAAHYAKRYITSRCLPDSAIDVVDQACARCRIAISSMPPALEKMERDIRELTIEKEAMRQEQNEEKEKALLERIKIAQKSFEKLKEEWQAEKTLLQDLKQAKKEVEALQQVADAAERDGIYAQVAEIRYGKIPELEKKINTLTAAMEKKEKASHFFKQEVDEEAIVEVIAHLTGIPISKLGASEQAKLLALEKSLQAKIVGQDEAITAVANAVRRSRAGIQNPNRPIGTFIFLGTTGVGKTALSQTLAENLFNDRKALIRIDLSEYQEQHTISRLIGAPPGYVGYEEGGQLTEAVRRKPHAVILLDEIEKAHPHLFNLLLPLLDEGHLTDNKGRLVNFKNTIIIMTSNLGAHLIQEKLATLKDDNQAAVMAHVRSTMLNLLHKSVPPEFLNRIDQTVIFNPLTQAMIQKIVDIKLTELQKRLVQRDITLHPSADYKAYLAQAGYDPQFGARPLERLLQDLLNYIAKELIAGTLKPHQSVHIHIDKKENLELMIK